MKRGWGSGGRGGGEALQPDKTRVTDGGGVGENGDKHLLDFRRG